MRIGILGGSFDPPHVGHLLAAVDAIETLALDRLIFIPAATQPLKLGFPGVAGGAAPLQRLAMVKLLIAGESRFAADPIEIDRGGLSYTVDTLEAYAVRHPAAERFFLVGADVLTSFAKWRQPERIVALARLTVLQRMGESVGPLELPPLPDLPPLLVLQTRRIDVSSTEIRERVRNGKSIHGFVPDSVAAYIAAERLYQ